MNCSPKRIRLVATAGTICLATVWASSIGAAAPKITRLSVRGFQAGGATRLLVQGSDLGGTPRLVLGAPLREQKLIGTAKSTAAEFDVVVDPSVAAGVYHLRIVTSEGITTPEIVTVDSLPQRAAAPVGSVRVEAAVELPIAMHGLVTGSTIQETRFAGRKGETVTIDVMARRMGSKLRPVVHLYDASKHQLAWSLPQTELAGDARLTVTLPADGDYTAAVHDLTYAAAAPGYYRLALGSYDYADQVFPPVVERGSSKPLESTPLESTPLESTPLELIGRFGNRTTRELAAPAVAAVLASSAGSNPGDSRALPWPDKTVPLGLRPRVRLSDLCELVEDRTLDASRTLPLLPVAVCGRLLKPGETDLYHVELTAGEKLQVEVFADRLGSPIDATLELRDENGARLAQADDVVGPDPRLDYTAPKKRSRVTIAVNDALSRGDESCLYRIVVSRLDDATRQADFRLTFSEDTHNVLGNGTTVFRVLVERTGYDGAIRLTVVGLPKGFVSTPTEIPAGADGALLEIRRSGTNEDLTFAPITIRGESLDAKPAIMHIAESAVHPLGNLQPWLKSELILAASETKAPLLAAWADDSMPNAAMYQGTDDKLSVRLERDPAAKGAVRLSLITTQAAPTGANQQQNAALMLRGIAATVDIKPDPKKETAEFAIRIPADLRTADYDLAIRAELLSVDGKTTVAESFTPSRRAHVRPPIEIVADAMPTVPIRLDSKTGAVVSLTGTLKRLHHYAGEVTITLVGLPMGVAAPSVVLKSKKEDFRLEFKLPPNFAATKIDGVKITAMITPDNRRVNTAAKTELAVPTLNVRQQETADRKPEKK
ncbi:MAG TPA: PPC domain-containing protein [Pirellulales bacterium]|jgi:hypothetical protein|nr:PPC domain-containing protein [Pirellulales bacterium]